MKNEEQYIEIQNALRDKLDLTDRIRMDEIKTVVRHEVRKCEERGIRDWSTIKNSLRENLREYIFSKTKRNPMIIPIIMEI